MEPEFYKVAEVAKIFKVTPQAVYKWVSDGKVKALELGPRALRISQAEVRRLKSAGLEAKDAASEIAA